MHPSKLQKLFKFSYNIEINKFKKRTLQQTTMSQQYQTPKKYFYTSSSNKSKLLDQQQNIDQNLQTTSVDQYLTIQRSIIQTNRNKLRSLLQQKNMLLGIEPSTPQFSPISKFSLKQSQYKTMNRISKFSLTAPTKQQSQTKTVFIRNDPEVLEDEKQDDNLMVKKISDRVKGIIKKQGQNKKLVYFTKNANIEMNHQIRNLIQQNTALRQQNQQNQIINIEKQKKIEQLTKQVRDLNKLFQQKQQNHHRLIQIKKTQIKNLQKSHQFQINKVKENFEQSLKDFFQSIIQKMEPINIKNYILSKNIAKFSNKISCFIKNFKVQQQIFNDSIYRKIKNISETSPTLQGDIQLEDEQKQKLQLEEQQNQKLLLEDQQKQRIYLKKQFNQGLQLQIKEKKNCELEEKKNFQLKKKYKKNSQLEQQEKFQLKQKKNSQLEQKKNFQLEQKKNFQLKKQQKKNFQLGKKQNNHFQLEKEQKNSFLLGKGQEKTFQSIKEQKKYFQLGKEQQKNFQLENEQNENFQLEKVKKQKFQLQQKKNFQSEKGQQKSFQSGKEQKKIPQLQKKQKIQLLKKQRLQLRKQQSQNIQLKEQVLFQKAQFQKQMQECNSKYEKLQKGFLQLKKNNLILVKQLQFMRLNQFKSSEQTKIYSCIQVQTENEEVNISNSINQDDILNKVDDIPNKVDQQCNTIKLDQIDSKKQKLIKNLQQEINKVRDQLQMLNKYFCQQLSNSQLKQEQINQLLLENSKKKLNSKQLAMVQNLAKKQRKQKNLAYIKLASLQKQLQSAKKKNQLYEQELSEHLQQQVAEEFTEQEKAMLNISDGNTGLQWQKVVKHKLKTILQQIKQIQTNQNYAS